MGPHEARAVEAADPAGGLEEGSGRFDSRAQAGEAGDEEALVGLARLKRAERVDNARDKLRKLQQRWDDRLTLERSFAERYVEGRLDLVYVFEPRVGSVGFKIQAIFKAYRGCTPGPHRGTRIEDAISRVGFTSDDSDHIEDGQDEAMLVHYVKVVKEGELLAVPSVVRLHFFNKFEDRNSGALYMSIFKRLWERIDVSCKREVDVVNVAAIGANEVAGHEVERGSKIMHRIPDDKREFFWRLFKEPDFPAPRPGILVLVNHKTARIAFNKRIDRLLKFCDVLVGPFNL